MPFHALIALDNASRKPKTRHKATVANRGPVLRLVCLGARRSGSLLLGTCGFECVLGRGGRSFRKKEGDGATPRGRFHFRSVLYRADRGTRPITGLPTTRLGVADGWCDDPQAMSYNRPTHFPGTKHGESLWRDDGLYDVIVPLGYNDRSVRRGGGSAIFFHLLSAGRTPTQGCVAVSKPDMFKILTACGGRGIMLI